MAQEDKAEWKEQLFVAIRFGDEDEQPVMMPVDDPSVLDDEDKKEQLIDSAWQFYQRGQFARETINPEFIKGLANDFSTALPLPDLLARELFRRLAADYVDRLEKEIQVTGEAAVDAHALHLKIEREGDEDVTIVLDLPEAWPEKAIASLKGMTSGIFRGASDSIGSWYGFTEWIWLNQVTRALEDLETELGGETLASMSQQEFWRTLLERILEHEDSTAHFGELVLRFVETMTDVMLEGISTVAPDLWVLELLLGLRDRPPEGTEFQGIRFQSRIVTVDFSSILNVLSERPDDLYRLSPRRFEELVAHIFAQLGYEVQLTPQSRDGGFDISAVRRSEADVRLLIECKRYIPPNKVGRPIVQQIYGVLLDREVQATKAIIATTSTFTSDARAFLANNRWKIEGRDRAGVLEWIQMVRKGRDDR